MCSFVTCMPIDIDECATRQGICDQLCNNTDGSYICTCKRGYELSDDGIHCQGIRVTCTYKNNFIADLIKPMKLLKSSYVTISHTHMNAVTISCMNCINLVVIS